VKIYIAAGFYHGGENMKKAILSLVISTLMACSFLTQANAELSSADKDFLIQQCQVSQADIDIIPKLSQETQTKISAWITAKDCEKLVSFKTTRNFYRQLLQLKPDEQLPFPPAGWNGNYLTEDEFGHYSKILTSHPY
jgi:hypothetical protein